MMRLACSAVLLSLLLPGLVRAGSKTFDITVAAGDHDRVNEPVSVAYHFPFSGPKAASAVVKDADGKDVPAQLTAPGLFYNGRGIGEPCEIHFILPRLKAGASATFNVTVSTDKPAKADGFVWSETKDESIDLKFGDRPVLRYMNAPFDESTKEKRYLTFKVFHHLYDPDGKQLVTNGAHGEKDVLYPHHRGIYYGFNKVTYGDDLKKTADVWHCTKGSHQAHEKVLASEAGPVLARQRLAIAWYGDDNAVFAREERELTVYNVPGGQLVEFASRLSSAGGKVHLDGDPQHAGFQFRADPEVAAKTAKQTYYLRPDGADKPGATRNWDAKEPDKHINLPWNAMSFVLGEQRFTAAYLDRPQNPKPARFSERDYGRFGSYFAADIAEQKPLDVNYRLWLQKGEMKGDEVAARSTAFVSPVKVTVK